MVERPGMGPEKLDVTCYLYQALLDLAEMAEALGREGEIAKPRELAALLRERFNRDWWLEDEGLFADSLDDQGSPQLAGHWTVAVPMEVGIADPEKGRRALARIEREWVNEWGMVHTRGSDTRVWTLPTGVLAMGEFRYENVAMGLRLLKDICSTLRRGMLGSYSELIPDGRGSDAALVRSNVYPRAGRGFMGPAAAGRSRRSGTLPAAPVPVEVHGDRRSPRRAAYTKFPLGRRCVDRSSWLGRRPATLPTPSPPRCRKGC